MLRRQSTVGLVAEMPAKRYSHEYRTGREHLNASKRLVV